MVKVVVLYERAPDAERYARHAEVAAAVPGATRFAHGPAFGRDPAFAYFAEFEFPDRESLDRAIRSDEFQASGKDAAEMGIAFTVTFVETS
jgi:uncharacterized protein (TIGR02118 family)